MYIFDRYILRELVGPFLFGVFAFTMIQFVFPLFEGIEFIMNKGAPLNLVLSFLLYSLPSMMVLTLPVSTLMTALLTFSNLSSGGEITALRVGGVSFYRLMVPVLAFACMVSVATIILNEEIVPRANQAVEDLRWSIVWKRDVKLSLKEVENEVVLVNNRYYLIFKKYLPERDVLQDVMIIEPTGESGTFLQYIAQEAEYSDNGWDFKNVNIFALEGDKVTPKGSFERTRFEVNITPLDIAHARHTKSAGQMNMRELRETISAKRKMGLPTRSEEVEFYLKLATPFSCLIFALFGAPLGLQPNPQSKSVGLGKSVIIVFIYFVILSLSRALGMGGQLPPILAAWLPNTIFGGAGGYFLAIRT